MAAPAALSKTCSKCDIEKALDDFQPNPNGRYGRKSTCRACNLAQTRVWRKANPDKRRAQKQRSWDRNRDRWNAERRTPEKRERAILERESCVECGSPKTQAHHEDYSKPVDVVWLCARCHSAVHRGVV